MHVCVWQLFLFHRGSFIIYDSMLNIKTEIALLSFLTATYDSIIIVGGTYRTRTTADSIN